MIFAYHPSLHQNNDFGHSKMYRLPHRVLYLEAKQRYQQLISRHHLSISLVSYCTIKFYFTLGLTYTQIRVNKSYFLRHDPYKWLLEHN